MLQPLSDEHFMKMALREAEIAFELDEVPVGAVVVAKGQIIGRSHNLTERLNDFTAHAEMQAFTSATEYLGGKYLDQCTLYVTLEPCPMCAGAAFWTRIGRIVFGAHDLKRGYQRLEKQLKHDTVIHPKTEVTGGIMEEECADLIKRFFASKRKPKLR
ncbi:MAG: nucleoside deaminase [Flavobacteriales bacterium]|nr:nucleoside deaminase [Flavobacteriales bacterium]MDG1767173.1 nucleoside deaminase [Flavobacteriales bacterium]